jgi:hypothetical protein
LENRIGIIADRRHPGNGMTVMHNKPIFKFAYIKRGVVNVVELHYGTFNGVPVWTKEKLNS